jgi:beta-lactamase class A
MVAAFLLLAPLLASGDRWPKLQYVQDAHLEAGLLRKIEALGMARAAREKRLAAILVDITILDEPRLAGINEHEMMYAASLPKIAILLGAFQKAADDGKPVDPLSLTMLTRMIRNSSNTAATTMLERTGFEYIAEVLTSARYHLYDEDGDGGLWVGKPYASGKAWKRDPLDHLSHAATAFQVARFYYLLESDRLVNPEASAQMREILSDPAIEHKFVRGLEVTKTGSRIWRKSGTWRSYHADSALVERDGRRYIAVAMANDPEGESWLSELIVAMDDLIFDPENIARDGS